MLIRPVVPALLAAVLLSSCAGLPPQLKLMFLPAEQVRHGGSDVAAGYYRLGRYHQDAGNLALALTAYTYASARDPKAPEPRIAAAAIHAQQGRLAQAKAMLRAVCAEYPALAHALNNLGYVYYLEGDYPAAAAAFRAVLARAPGNERARNNLRLAEGAGVRGAAALATVAPLPVQAATPAAGDTKPVPAAIPAAAAPSAGGGMQLVRLAPNVYELKATPAVAEARAPAAGTPPPSAAVAGRLEIANGNGDTGMAKRFRDMLAGHGIRAARLTNARPFGEAATRIEFRPGFEAGAQSLHAALGGKAVLRPQNRLAAPADIRLVLGKDAAVALAQLRTPGTTLLAGAATSSHHPTTSTQERP